jgi:hypothetical protein
MTNLIGKQFDASSLTSAGLLNTEFASTDQIKDRPSLAIQMLTMEDVLTRDCQPLAVFFFYMEGQLRGAVVDNAV